MKRFLLIISFLLAASTAQATEISWWKFDSNSNDSVGSNNGTNINSPTYIAGKLNSAISLAQASTQYVQISNTNLITTNDWSICAWIKLSATSTDRYIFSLGDNDGTTGGLSGFHLRIRTTDVLRASINTGAGNQTVTSTGTIPEDGTWTHVCAVKNGTSAKTYINKVEDGSTTLGSATMDYNGDSGEVHTRIGDGAAAGASFDGLIDEVHLYDAAIDQTTIDALFTVGSSLHMRVGAVAFQ